MIFFSESKDGEDRLLLPVEPGKSEASPWPVVLSCMSASLSVSGISGLVSESQAQLGKSVNSSFKSLLVFELTLS